jgi:mRNA interferase RelE/StbE
VASLGLEPSAYGTHSMRRTKVAQIYKKTGNLRAVQLLLGHTKMDSTVRYLGVDIEDTLTLSEGIDLWDKHGWRELAALVAQSDIVLYAVLRVAYSIIMRQISYTKAAIRALRRMPANTATLIRSKIEAYARDPASQANNVRCLKERVGGRLRVGDWRVIMDDQGNVLAVLDIGPRGGDYD